MSFSPPISRHVALVGALLTAAASPQGVRVTGRVVDRAGEPVAGARVTLRSYLRPMRDDLGPAHVIEVVTNKTGRFRADLLPSRRYSAWARLPGEVPRFTNFEHDVRFARPCVLTEAAFECRELRVLVRGLDAWIAERGPFRFRLVTATVHFEALPLRLEDGVVAIPAVPGEHAYLEILDRDGHGFWQARLRLRKLTKTDSRDEEVVIPPPLEVPMRVVSLADGRPVAGARVSFEAYRTSSPLPAWSDTVARDAQCPLGRTDAGGCITLRVPRTWAKRSRRYLPLLIEAGGYVNGYADVQKHGEASLYELEERDGEPPRIEVKLRPGYELTGKVLGRDGKPVAGLRMLTNRAAAFHLGDLGASWRVLSELVVRTAADGSFRISGSMPTTAAHIEAFPTQKQLHRLLPPIPDGLAAPPSIQLWHGLASRDWRGERKLGELGRNLRRVRIDVLDQHGTARFPNALVARREGQKLCQPFVVGGDRRGKLLLVLSPGDYDVAAWDATRGYRIHGLSLSAAGKAPPKTELTLEPFRWVTGKTVDQDGRPVAGATMQWRGGGDSGYVPPMISVLNGVLLRQESDAQGRFRVPFVPHPNSHYTLGASCRRGWTHKTIRVGGVEDIENVSLVFRLRRARR